MYFSKYIILMHQVLTYYNEQSSRILVILWSTGSERLWIRVQMLISSIMHSEDSFPLERLIGHNVSAKLNLTGGRANTFNGATRSQSALIKFSPVRISWRRINRISPCARFIAARPRKWSALTWLGSPIDLNVAVRKRNIYGCTCACMRVCTCACTRVHTLTARRRAESRRGCRDEYLFADYLRSRTCYPVESCCCRANKFGKFE